MILSTILHKNKETQQSCVRRLLGFFICLLLLPIIGHMLTDLLSFDYTPVILREFILFHWVKKRNEIINSVNQ